MGNDKFEKSVESLGTGVLDSVFGACKQVLSGGIILIGGARKTLDNSLEVADAAISEVGIGTINKLRDISLSTTKKVARTGLDTVKDVAGTIKDGGKEVIDEVKNFMPTPKGNANVQAQPQSQPQTPEEKKAYVAKAKADAEAAIKAGTDQLEAAKKAEDRLNSGK